MPSACVFKDSATATDQLEAFGLNAKMAYELIVIGPDGSLWDRRSFRALDNEKHRARLAVLSGLDEHFADRTRLALAAALGAKPDAILIVGNSIHPEGTSGGEGATPEALWKSYAESRAHLALFHADPLVPVFAMWDDQDLGQNNGNRTSAHGLAASDAFFAFFPQRKSGSGFDAGPGARRGGRHFECTLP